MKAAILQIECNNDIQGNIDKAFSMAKKAKTEGADIICFPEFFSYPWFPYSKIKNLSAFNNDDTVEQSIGLAKELGTFLVTGYYETEANKQFNTALLIDPKGNIIGKYRKNHLPELPYFYEKSWYSQGNLGLPIFETEIGKIGLLICSDVMFLQNAQIMQLKGAELIFNPRCVVKAGHYRWQKMLIANSIIGGCYVFSANRTGNYNEMQFDGHSIIIGPGGNIIKEIENQEDFLITEYDLEKVKDAQSKYPCILEPNIELYVNEFNNLLAKSKVPG